MKNSPLNRILNPLASLKLTVALLVLAMVLVFAGTWAQRFNGINTVQKQYFHSLLVSVPVRIFLPEPKPGQSPVRGTFPWPGGYAVGAMLLVNLISAHVVRFKFTLKRTGVILIHSGLILLLVGEGITSYSAIESQMWIQNGSFAKFTRDPHRVELAVIDAKTDHDEVIAVPASRLKTGVTLHEGEGRLPFAIKVEDYYPNSNVLGPFQARQKNIESKATVGSWKGVAVEEVREFIGAGEQASRIDQPSAYITPIIDGKPAGTYLVTSFEEYDLAAKPQEVKVGDKTYQIALRFKRYYKPYTVTLKKFSHDYYTGTTTPKNFSSDIRLTDPSRNVDRDVRIWMNHPLYYAGETFYQSSWLKGNKDTDPDRGTILMVVDNPAWVMPYLSVIIAGLGMMVHFGIALVTFIDRNATRRAKEAAAEANATADADSRRGPRGDKRQSASARKSSRGDSYTLMPGRPRWMSAGFIFPASVVICCLVYLVSVAIPPRQSSPFNLNSFGQIPVSYEGRTQPLDSLARNSLRIISGRDEQRMEDKDGKYAGSRPAIEWLLDVFATDAALEQPIFRIDHPDLVGMLTEAGKEKEAEKKKYFSFKEIEAHRSELERQMSLMENVPGDKRDLYQRKVAELADKYMLFMKLSQQGGLFLAPPLAPGEQWKALGQVAREARETGKSNEAAQHFMKMVEAYGTNDAVAFSTQLAMDHALLDQKIPAETARVRFETLFNRLQPFYTGMWFYVIAFLLAAGSWLGWTKPLSRAAFWLLGLTLIFHTLALVGRIYIQGRPPVTNLYSSAIFIAWGAVVLSLILELFFRNGIGSVSASVMGAVSLLIAHNLSSDGHDTMAMLQAVLDTNIWLATHVVVITIGYASTFLAGILAIIYVVRGVFTDSLEPEDAKDLSRMVYGIVCFAMLFSFVGTILGGIWADQSWGRFWGWDAKENGAVLIVIWNALILHARWGGLVRDRGLALLAIFGNVVTCWSWFGTNMLGVGLHSYGFMDSAFFWLVLVIALHLFLIGVGSIPMAYWASATTLKGAGLRAGKATK